MIKDVINSFTTTKNTGETSTLSEAKGNTTNTEAVKNGFFEKILQALQSSGDETEKNTPQNNPGPAKQVSTENSEAENGNKPQANTENSDKPQGFINEDPKTLLTFPGQHKGNAQPLTESVSQTDKTVPEGDTYEESEAVSELTGEKEKTDQPSNLSKIKAQPATEEAKQAETAEQVTGSKSTGIEKLAAGGQEPSKMAESSLNQVAPAQTQEEHTGLEMMKEKPEAAEKAPEAKNITTSETEAKPQNNLKNGITTTAETRPGVAPEVSGSDKQNPELTRQNTGSAESGKVQENVSHISAREKTIPLNNSDQNKPVPPKIISGEEPLAKVAGAKAPEVSNSVGNIQAAEGMEKVIKAKTPESSNNPGNEGKANAETLLNQQGERITEVGRKAPSVRGQAPGFEQRAASSVKTEAGQVQNAGALTREEPEMPANIHQMLHRKSGQDILEQVAGIQSSKYQEYRDKRNNLSERGSDPRHPLTEERLSVITDSPAGRQRAFGQNLQFGQSSQNSSQNAGSLSKEQEAFLKDQMMETTEVKDSSKSEQNNSGQMRLGELPIVNQLLRRSVMPGLAATLQKATASGKAIPENWQKHNFDLEDGNKIELSTRNVDGVIQVKLASSSIELSRIMQQYAEEIKEHLEKECELNIDLQFEDKSEQETSGFLGDSSPRGGRGSRSGNMHNGNKISNQQAEQNLQKSVRKFGYNRMEWTA